MTPLAARDEMLAVLKAALATDAIPAEWPDVPGFVPPTDVPWVRPTIMHVSGRQSSLSDATGVRRHTASGVLTVQVMAPMGDGGTVAYTIAELVLAAYCGAHGSVWYRNQRIKDAGDDGAFVLKNVQVDFSYDQLR